MELFLKKFDNIKLKLIRRGRKYKYRYLFPVIFIIVFEIFYLRSLYLNVQIIERYEFILGSISFTFIILYGFLRIPALKFVPGNIIKKIYIQFKSVIILNLLRRNRINAKYYPNIPVSKDKFIRSSIFSNEIIQYKGSDGFAGKVNNHNFQLSEIHVKSNFRSIFSGFFIELQMGNIIGSKPNTVILSNHLIKEMHKKSFPLEIETMYFENDKKYKIISSHNSVIHQNHLIKLLADFIELTKKDVYISLSSSVIYIAVSINDQIFELDLSRKANDAKRLNEHIRIFNASIDLLKKISSIYPEISD